LAQSDKKDARILELERTITLLERQPGAYWFDKWKISEAKLERALDALRKIHDWSFDIDGDCVKDARLTALETINRIEGA